MKYTKKPITIEAVQWTGNNLEEICDFIADGSMEYNPIDGLFIKTLEGVHHASVGDYIIKGVHGEFYPCKPDIFEETYSPAKTADEMFRELGYRRSAKNRYERPEKVDSNGCWTYTEIVIDEDEVIKQTHVESERAVYGQYLNGKELRAVCKLLDEMGVE